MAKPRYQVFVSSTFNDLKYEREEIMKILLELEYFPAGMEIFPAADDTQVKYIQQIIDDSDYYLLIIGGKYGSTNREGISYTELEFDYAVKTKKPILAFIIENQNILADKVDNDATKRKKLTKFISKVQTDRITKYWKNADDLKVKVSTTLSTTERYQAIGWLRGDHKAKAVDFDEIKEIREKVLYFKFINFRAADPEGIEIYQRHIERLNRPIKVTSEYIFTKTIKLDQMIKNYKGRDRTNGDSIEVDSLVPFKLNLDDGDRRSYIIEPVISTPSDVIVLTGTVCNGFKTGDMDLGIKAEKNIASTKLIVDFSSIPDFRDILKVRPRLFHNRFSDDTEGNNALTDNELFDFTEQKNGVFVASIEGLKKDEGFRFEFSDDLDIISNVL